MGRSLVQGIPNGLSVTPAFLSLEDSAEESKRWLGLGMVSRALSCRCAWRKPDASANVSVSSDQNEYLNCISLLPAQPQLPSVWRLRLRAPRSSYAYNFQITVVHRSARHHRLLTGRQHLKTLQSVTAINIPGLYRYSIPIACQDASWGISAREEARVEAHQRRPSSTFVCIAQHRPKSVAQTRG